ncbi:MAG: signal peptidase I [Candidatus Dormibacteria bacterium]
MLAAVRAGTGSLSPGRAATRARDAARRLARRLAGSLRRPVNVAFLVVLAVVAAGWWVALRPTSFLDGPASFLVVKGTSMLPTLHTGDLVLAEARPSYHVGDLVVYAVPRGQIGAGDDLIHRIVAGSAAAGYTLKGDNNPAPDPWTVPAHDILGREAVVLPGAGRWLLVLRTPLFAGLTAAAVAVWLVASPPAWVRRRRTPVPSTAAIPDTPGEPPVEPAPAAAARAARPPASRRARAPARSPGLRAPAAPPAPPGPRRPRAARRQPEAGCVRDAGRPRGGRSARATPPARPPAPR